MKYFEVLLWRTSRCDGSKPVRLASVGRPNHNFVCDTIVSASGFVS